MSLYYKYCYCTFFYKNYTANHRSFQLYFLWNMSFILSMSFCTFFYKNYTANHRSFQLFFLWNMSFILSIDFWENTYKNNTANHRSFQPLFFEIYVPMLSLIFCTFLSQYSTFFNAHAHLFINCPLNANQSVYICYKYLLIWLNKAILSTFLTIQTTALLIFVMSFI